MKTSDRKKLILCAIAAATIAIVLQLLGVPLGGPPPAGASTSHPPFCGHGNYIYYPGGNTDRLRYHHYLNSQGDHMHFYIHERLVSFQWVNLHGFWKFC